MWLTASAVLAEGDIGSDGTVTGIVIALIGAATTVTVAWIRKERDAPAITPDPDARPLAPAIEAAARQGMDAAGEIYKSELALERAERAESDEQQRRQLADVRAERDLWMGRAYAKGWTNDA